MSIQDQDGAESGAPVWRTRNRAANLWVLIEQFYTGKTIFNEIFERYERMVAKFARERGVDRRFLRLNTQEVGSLLNFKELEDLRDRYVYPLKELSHALFRGKDSTDKFDRYVSDLFHELSILKEEQYKVRTYAPEYEQTHEQEELESILAEVHEFFPQKVHHIHALFRKAQARLEELLPAHNRETIVIRSLYLYGPDLLAPVYPGGIEDLYEIVYARGGVFEGYLEVARSFLGAGFKEEAREALGKLLEALDRSRRDDDIASEFKDEAEYLLRKLGSVGAEPASEAREIG